MFFEVRDTQPNYLLQSPPVAQEDEAGPVKGARGGGILFQVALCLAESPGFCHPPGQAPVEALEEKGC